MSLLCDRTGYPLVALPELGVAVQLLALTKVQYECYLSEPGMPGDAHYEELLKTNPRVSHVEVVTENREGLFLTGILPEEVEQVARWLGPQWRVPSSEDWRSVCAALATTPIPESLTGGAAAAGLHPAARATIDVLLRQLRTTNLLEMSLMRGGVLEWVQFRREWGGLGEPRPEFASYLIDPLHGDPIIPIRRDRRMKEFGARLMRSL